MPQGDRRGSSYEFYDFSYDGEWSGNELKNGLGCLTDGDYGPENFKLSYYDKSELAPFLSFDDKATDPMHACMHTRMRTRNLDTFVETTNSKEEGKKERKKETGPRSHATERRNDEGNSISVFCSVASSRVVFSGATT